MRSILFRSSWLALVLTLVAATVATSVLAAETSGFLRSNLHVQDQMDKKGGHVLKANYSGWIDAPPPTFLVPAGTEVTVGELRRGFVPSFLIRIKADGREIVFEYQEKYMEISAEAYIARLVSAEPVSFAGLSKIDQQGIREGKALPGMSKDGVLAALGIPPTHKTPSLEGNAWTYWKDRFRTLVVEFENGKVSTIRE